ncbi:hypothetical protein QBC35DRAFT_500542 [Podospora australis]|uniref:Yeast cell wall synthesis Kre9/Knh1-like N-terminal domain-containing protein n=1 Tax=Podospora australis TaxID=1536484 RepID=A0AAN7AHE9_9PEZI|nr:hypothetical protein QBC35DRAFT_500542 [Podospora australis]
MRASILLFASAVSAIQITSPTKNSVVDISSGVKVEWTTVSTDPSSAHLFLVNMASGHTPYSKDLGEIDLSSGSILVSEKDVPEDGAYQFNFQSLKQNNMGILAQSEQFHVSEEESSDDKQSTTLVVASTSVKKTSTAATASVTGTASTTLATVSGSSTASASAEEGTASSTGSAASASATGSTDDVEESSAVSVKQGGSMLALVAGIVAVIAA